MFYIIKKGTGNFWHRFNNDSKEVNISKWEVVLDNVNQTVSLQMPNGSNIPANEVGILDVIVIDETGANVNETFSNVLSLRVRLVTLGYNPYDSSGGGGGATTFLGLTDVPNNYSGQAGKIVKVKATEDGLEFDNPIVNVPSLQEVLTEGNYITKTKAEIDALISADGLIPFQPYEITGVDMALYGGTTIYVKALNENTLEFDGIGKFYNPKYDQSVSGFNVWTINGTYSIGDKVHWGGKTWINVNGSVGDQVDIYTLDSEWSEIAFNDTDYNVAYDHIKYDYANDIIVYRNEQNSNIVTTSSTYINTRENPIKSFMWGNLYASPLFVGIGEQKIINSYNENLNFRGSFQVNLNFDNGSSQSSINFDNGSSQRYLNFDNGSSQSSINFDNGSSQRYLNFDNGSYQENLNFDNGSSQEYLNFDNGSSQGVINFDNGSSQGNLNFDNGSFQINLNFDNNSSQAYLNFDNGSFQINLNFDNNSPQAYLNFENGSSQAYLNFNNGSSQVNLNFDNNSSQSNLTETSGKNQQNITFNNYQFDRTTSTLIANEVGLAFQGDLPISATATKMLVKEDNQVKEMDIPAPITIDATPTNGSPNAVSSDGTFDALATKVDKNTAITGATKTKITYDSKGLVTAGADLAASDLPTGIDASKINTGVVSNTEFNQLDGVNAPIQTQLDGKLSESDVNIFCDFNSAPSTAQFAFYENFYNSKNGTGYATTATNAPIVDASNMGVWYLKAGSGANNYNSIGSGADNTTLNQIALSLNISSYETFVYLDNLTDSSYFISGFINQALNVIQTNGCYFLYNPTLNSGRIQCITVNSVTGATTTLLTGITVTNKWFKFKVVATSTSVLYYVDGSLVATHTTNIPTARMGYGFGINNGTVGATTVGIYADFFRVKFKNLR